MAGSVDFGEYNPVNAFSQGYGLAEGMRQTQAQRQAGNALAMGDTRGATNALYQAGDLQNGNALEQQQRQQQDKETADKLKFMAVAADALGNIPDDATHTARQAALQQHVVPTLRAMGIDPQTVQAIASADLSDQSLAMFKSQVESEIVNRGDGGYDVVNKKGGGLIRSVAPSPKPFELDPEKNYIVPDPTNTGTPATAAAAPAAAAPTATPNADAVWAAMKQRESGGNGNAVSSEGALGSTQMLPATAQAMAQKLGVAWRPDLIKGNSPDALAYQDKLGRAYFDEGLQKYGGDVTQAAMYYHGGPDQRIWGPKTRAYAQAVTRGQPALQGGAGADALNDAPAGYRYVQRAQASPEAGGLDDSTLDLLAGRYLIDGTTPPLGQGKVGSENRAKFFNRVSILAKTMGIDAGDLVAGTASTRSLAKGLTNLTNIKAQITASEMTVVKNADYALSLAPKAAGPTRMPVFDRWIQAGRKATGDADVAQFNAALGTVADEYAKVMSSNTGSGGMTSDSARAEARSRLNSAMNPQQLQAVITAMKTEMNNRVTSMSEVESGLRAKLHGGSGGAAPADTAAASPRIRRYNPATGRLE